MALKGVENLNHICSQFVRQFVKDNSIYCEMGEDFAYYCSEENPPHISYTVLDTPKIDDIFKEYLLKKYAIKFENDFDIFIFSFLHEIGHALTIYKIPDRILNRCSNHKNYLQRYAVNKHKKDTKKRWRKALFKYWELTDEKQANLIAVKIWKKYPEKVQEFKERITRALTVFYMVNQM